MPNFPMPILKQMAKNGQWKVADVSCTMGPYFIPKMVQRQCQWIIFAIVEFLRGAFRILPWSCWDLGQILDVKLKVSMSTLTKADKKILSDLLWVHSSRQQQQQGGGEEASNMI